MTFLFFFSQPWLSEPEPDFHSGSVEIRQEGGILHLQTDFSQSLIQTKATAHQQRLWELGDVLEFFVQRVGDDDYYEYQIAPNGMMMALHYPNRHAVSAVRKGECQMEEYLCDLPLEGSAIVTPAGWHASLTIPAPGEQFRVNCGRYDCSSGPTPVVSCTAPLTKRDFHRTEEWLVLE